jgi:rfaE bifunctional protein nucleotidyltransferase chain/domain
LSLEEALSLRAGKQLVLTNGHFDLLHIGHLDYLEKAQAHGELLFVGINSDASAARLKPGRPIVPAVERARLVAALWPVTATIIFEEDTAEALVHALQPQIYVKGADYSDKPLPERKVVEGYGGRVVLIDTLPEHSTSHLIARMQAIRDTHDR